MNRPSRTDEPLEGEGLNQSPNAFSNDLTTNQDLNGRVNSRALKGTEPPPLESAGAIMGTEGADSIGGTTSSASNYGRRSLTYVVERTKRAVVNFAKFVGPGFMIAVAYSSSPPSPSSLL